MRSERQANFELLRIIAMFMIIALHYLNKGNVIAPYTDDQSAVNYAAHLIEAFCIVAVNCYVLISGYFLVEADWKANHAGIIVAQVLFYCILIPVILICTGQLRLHDLSVYDWLTYLLPIETEHYWFATAYLVMYMLAPLLAAGVRAVGRRTLRVVIGLLLLYFCIWKSLIPTTIATDHYGYDFGWFICLFLIAAYIRLYGLTFLNQKWGAALFYTVMCLCIFILTIVSSVLSQTKEVFAYYIGMPTTYNHILCLLGAIGLFMLFKNMRAWEGKIAEIIKRLSRYTFGVYLLHEHALVRYQWMQWLGVDRVQGSFLFVPHMIVCILIVYVLGTIIDCIRTWFFEETDNVMDSIDYIN